MNRQPPGSPQPRPIDRSAPTQVGQIIQGWRNRLTGRFASPRASAPRRGQPVPSREQIAHLIHALGEPGDPDHANALETLVKIGAPAVPLLNEALTPENPWLTSYRAADALGRIGDGRATAPLIQALRHSHSNVRWSAVRSLAQVGDLRALFELRRVAHEDHGRTSWGESVAGAAQSALDQIQAQSVWNQSLELMKTAVTSVLMILSLILAFSVVTMLRNEIEQVGQAASAGPVNVRVLAPTGVPVPAGGHSSAQPLALATSTTPTWEPLTLSGTTTPTPLSTSTSAFASTSTVADSTPTGEGIRGRVLSGANVRPFPSVRNEPVGIVSQGDDILFLGVSPDSMWYHIRLGSSYSDSSYIDNPDGSRSGWVHRELVSQPDEEVPVENADDADDAKATPDPFTTASPLVP